MAVRNLNEGCAYAAIIENYTIRRGAGAEIDCRERHWTLKRKQQERQMLAEFFGGGRGLRQHGCLTSDAETLQVCTLDVALRRLRIALSQY